MATMRVALLQLLTPGADPERAAAEGERACRAAATMGAEVALFPELWQIGYTPCPGEAAGEAAWMAHATSVGDPFVSRFRALARELGMAIVITYLQRWDGAPRNAATLIDRRGRIRLTYAKVHTTDFNFERVLTPGSQFSAVDLELAAGRVRVGLMICFDREHPESARALMVEGAEIVLVPNACVIDAERIGQLRARAFENMLGIAMANYARPQDGRPIGPGAPDGHSVAFSGICYAPDGTPLDHELVRGDRGPAILLASFDLDALRAYRAREPWGAAYRRPSAYAPLVGESASPVFARPRARHATSSARAATNGRSHGDRAGMA